ncbi:MAG: CcmD family protein [Ferruginibacter sp.]
MNRILRFWFFIFIFSAPLLALAQEKAEMADTMRSNGKIYVVVAVCLIILTGLFLYVWRIDKKIVRLEKENRVMY